MSRRRDLEAQTSRQADLIHDLTKAAYSFLGRASAAGIKMREQVAVPAGIERLAIDQLNRLQLPAVDEILAENETLRAQLAEATAEKAAEPEEATAQAAQNTAHIVGTDLSIARPHVHLDPATQRLFIHPRQAGKSASQLVDLWFGGTTKSEDQIRRETLEKVINALELEEYALPKLLPGLFILREGDNNASGADRLWADIETTLADRADDAEMDRIEAARARIESIRRPAEDSVPETELLDGEVIFTGKADSL